MLLFLVFFPSIFFLSHKRFLPTNILTSTFIFSSPYLLETQTDFSIACRAGFERRIWGQTQRRADLTVSSPRVRKFQVVPWNITTCAKYLCAASGWNTTSPYLTLIFDINVHWCSLGVPHSTLFLCSVFCSLYWLYFSLSGAQLSDHCKVILWQCWSLVVKLLHKCYWIQMEFFFSTNLFFLKSSYLMKSK